jgi:streptogramin lyase
MTRTGAVTEYRVSGFPASIAVTRDGRVWFTSAAGWRHPRLGFIDSAGKSRVACAARGCGFEPSGLVAGPDGSLWYGLARPNLNEGGGGNGIWITMEIRNEAGLIAHLEP